MIIALKVLETTPRDLLETRYDITDNLYDMFCDFDTTLMREIYDDYNEDYCTSPDFKHQALSCTRFWEIAKKSYSGKEIYDNFMWVHWDYLKIDIIDEDKATVHIGFEIDRYFYETIEEFANDNN